MELKTWGHVNGQIEQHKFRLKPPDKAKYFVQCIPIIWFNETIRQQMKFDLVFHYTCIVPTDVMCLQ
jgi:hypothetical protein